MGGAGQRADGQRPAVRGRSGLRPAAHRAAGRPGRAGRPQPACALALLGQTSRWKAGARATLRALATIIAALPDPAAGPARATASKSDRAASTPAPTTASSIDRCQHHHGQPQRDQHGRAQPGRRRHAGHRAGRRGALGHRRRRLRPADPGVQPGGRGAVRPQPGRRRWAWTCPRRWCPSATGSCSWTPWPATWPPGTAAGSASRVRLRALRADGTERPVELTPMPVTVGGRDLLLRLPAGRLRAGGRATTAVAEGEARFRLLSEIAPVGIVQTDVDGICRFVNDKWCEMSGHPGHRGHRPQLAQHHQPR